MRVLVLGHAGMLGRAVVQFYREKCAVGVTKYRWPSNSFKDVIRNFNGDLLINCIGAIPQKTTDFTINYGLPQFIIENLHPDTKYIHPDTDCVFDGKIAVGELYNKRQSSNATEEYGLSKASIMRFQGTPSLRIVRSSVIGIDKHNQLLLSWFLSQTKAVNGYVNHYWNGITTHAWAQMSKHIFDYWDHFDILTQVGTVPISKYSLLCLIKDVFNKQIKINEAEGTHTINRCLQTDIEVAPIKQQLEELQNIYRREL